jgi:WD40 repeat protein
VTDAREAGRLDDAQLQVPLKPAPTHLCVGSFFWPLLSLASMGSMMRILTQYLDSASKSSAARLRLQGAAFPLALVMLLISWSPQGLGDEIMPEAEAALKDGPALAFEDLPNDVTTVLGSRRFRSDWDQLSICYSSNGNLIATGNQGSIDLFNPQSGERIKHITRKEPRALEWVGDLQFVQNDKVLLCSAGGKVYFWDPKTGEPKRIIEATEQHVIDLDISPDENLIATSGRDSVIRIWDTVTGAKRLEIKTKRDVNDIEFSADGRQLYSWGFNDQLIRRFDVASGEQLSANDAPFRYVALLPNAKRFVGTEDSGKRIVFGLTEQYEPLQLPKADDHQTVVGHSTDGQLIILIQGMGYDRPWDTSSGSAPPEKPGPHVEVWDLDKRSIVYSLPYGHVRRPGHGGAGYRFAFAPGGNTLAHTRGLQVDRWNLTTGEAFSSPEGHSGSIEDICFSSDGMALATVSAEDGKLLTWDLKTRRLTHEFSAASTEYWPDHERVWQARSVAFLEDGEVAGSPIKQGIRIWKTDVPHTYRDLQPTFEHNEDGYFISFTSTGNSLAVARGDHVYLFDPQSGQRTAKLSEHWGGVRSLAATPDGDYLASGSLDRSVVLWDLRSGMALRVLEGARGMTESIGLSSDAQIVAAGSNEGDVLIWNGQNGELLHHTRIPDRRPFRVAVSPDGKVLAVGTDQLRLYDARTGQQIMRVAGIGGWIARLAFSPDGEILATAIGRGGPTLWNVSRLMAAKKHGAETE